MTCLGVKSAGNEITRNGKRQSGTENLTVVIYSIDFSNKPNKPTQPMLRNESTLAGSSGSATNDRTYHRATPSLPLVQHSSSLACTLRRRGRSYEGMVFWFLFKGTPRVTKHPIDHKTGTELHQFDRQLNFDGLLSGNTLPVFQWKLW